MSTAPALAPACQNHPDVSTGLKACARCGNTFCSDCVVELQGKTACATCKDEVLRDLRSGAGELDLAGAGKRFVGALVDSLVIGVPFIVIVMVGFGAAALASGGMGASLGIGLLGGLLQFIYDGLMTANGARLTFDEDIKGPLVPGRYADLAVLSQDPVTANATELKAIKCTATLVGGRIVHGALS